MLFSLIYFCSFTKQNNNVFALSHKQFIILVRIKKCHTESIYCKNSDKNEIIQLKVLKFANLLI